MSARVADCSGDEQDAIGPSQTQLRPIGIECLALINNETVRRLQGGERGLRLRNAGIDNRRRDSLDDELARERPSEGPDAHRGAERDQGDGFGRR